MGKRMTAERLAEWERDYTIFEDDPARGEVLKLKYDEDKLELWEALKAERAMVEYLRGCQKRLALERDLEREVVERVEALERVSFQKIRQLSECNPEFGKSEWVLASSPFTDKYPTLEAALKEHKHE